MLRNLAFTLVFLASLSSSQAAYLSEVQKRSFTGIGTWYNASDVVIGACGTLLQNSSFTVALAPQQFVGADGTVRTACGKVVEITAEGQTVQASVADRCRSCLSGDLNMTPDLFEQFAPTSVGIISVTWDFVED